MIAPESRGASKLGGAWKLTAPVALSMLKKSLSVPPRVQLSVVPASRSLAVAWYTVPVLYSGTEELPPEVMTTVSLSLLVTLTSAALRPL